MENVRENLIKLLNHQFGKKVSEIVADWLIANGVTIEDRDTTSNLIHAMTQYALENSWNDSEAIDALVDIGITREDFCRAGMGEFVKIYFDDEPERADIDRLIQSVTDRVGDSMQQSSSVEKKELQR